MRLEQLIYVVMIANCRSISKAAKNLYITQPALSNALKDLEKELGFSIFHRNMQGVTLTEKGEEFYQIACSIQNDIERIRRLSDKGLHVTSISIAATPMVCGYMFMEVMDSIKIAFPDLDVDVNEMRFGQLIRALKSDSVDIALCSYTAFQKKKYVETVAQLGLERETLIRCPMAAFVPAKSPLARENLLSLEQLSKYPLICFKDYDKGIAEISAISDMMPSVFYTFTDRGSIKDAIAHEKGYALLPVSMALDDIYLEYDKIKMIPLKETSYIELDLVFHKSKLLSKEEVTVLELIRDYIRRMNVRLRKMYNPADGSCAGTGIQFPY